MDRFFIIFMILNASLWYGNKEEGFFQSFNFGMGDSGMIAYWGRTQFLTLYQFIENELVIWNEFFLLQIMNDFLKYILGSGSLAINFD